MDVLRRRLFGPFAWAALVAPIAVAPIAVAPIAVGRASAAAAASDDEDVPKRLPTVEWEVPVDCDDAGQPPPGGALRSCTIATAGGALYLHQHGDPGDSAATFRLTRRDLDTGAERWSRDVGPTAELTALDDIVVVSDKSHFEVYDATSGDLRFERDGTIAEINRYGTVLIVDDRTITALDPVDGTALWTEEGDLGAYCRDIVVVVAARSDTSGSRRFAVVDHRSGETWWESDEPFDPSIDEVTCGYGPFVYTTDGDRLHEWDAFSGWLNWTAAVSDPGSIELYREVALVRSDVDPATVVAVARETGEVAWERPAAEVGTVVSIVGRVREDTTGVFTLHPMSGAIVNHTSVPGDLTFRVVGASETRVVIAAGNVITSYGMNDLGAAWQLELEAPPDEVVVARGVLVVRTGGSLRGYG